MWVDAVECIVDVLQASLQSSSSVLLTDFEEGKGFQMLMTTMRFTSQERFLKVLNTISALIFDPNAKRDENSIPFTHLGNYLSEYLWEAIGWPQDARWENDAGVLFKIASFMTVHSVDRIFSREYIVQGFAYTILKLFSMEPTSCALLEEQFHFLGTLILTIPCLAPQDVVTAVLTVVNYVFQCVESASAALIPALCAACATLIHRSLDEARVALPTRVLSLSHAELLFASMEAVSRTNNKFVVLFLSNGLLKLMMTDALERLYVQLFPASTGPPPTTTTTTTSTAATTGGVALDAHSVETYRRITTLITDLNALNQYAVEEIRKSGTMTLLRRISVAPQISPEMARCLLRLTEDIAQVDTLYLSESLAALYLLVREVPASDGHKIAALVDSVWKMLIRNEEWAPIHVQSGGLETCFEVLSALYRVFLDSGKASASVGLSSAFGSR